MHGSSTESYIPVVLGILILAIPNVVALVSPIILIGLQTHVAIYNVVPYMIKSNFVGDCGHVTYHRKANPL